MTTSTLPPYRQWAALAPWATAVVLVVCAVSMPNRVTFDEVSETRKAEIAATFGRVPFFIGSWFGQDEPVPPEAQKLLRPNAIFSRTYSTTDGPTLHVLVVHCSDARDMIGHYPPVCYPSAGWERVEPVSPPDQHMRMGGVEVPVRLYHFRRMRERGVEDHIRIFSAFVLPDGSVTREISDINRQAQRLAVSRQGVAQLQVIAPTSVDFADAVAAAEELLGGMGELFAALGVGQGASSDI